MEDADALAVPEEVALDPLSRAALEAHGDRQLAKQIELLQAYARREPAGKRRRIVLRFCVSPVEILGDAAGRVEAVRLVHNELAEDEEGRIRPRPTDRTEVLPAGLVFRSVGYLGVPLPDVPFHERWGTIPNEAGRVTRGAGGDAVAGLYVAGWIKRGPSGVIGTNKHDAQETVAAMLEDAARGATLHPSDPDPSAVERLVRSRQPDVFTYDDWRRLDAHEVAAGEAAGRPRVKLCSIEAMLSALGRAAAPREIEG